MGRVGEVICRTWQTADKMKKLRGRLADEKVPYKSAYYHEDNDYDNFKVYLATTYIYVYMLQVRRTFRSICFNPGQFGAGTKHRSRVIVLPMQKVS